MSHINGRHHLNVKLSRFHSVLAQMVGTARGGFVRARVLQTSGSTEAGCFEMMQKYPCDRLFTFASPSRGRSINCVVPFAKIQSYVREVARQFKPKKVVLFGSHAYGTSGVDSDVDLLVIMTHSGRPPYREAKIRTAIRAPFPVDLMVRTPRRLQKRLAMKDSFMTEIMHKGRVLHEG